MNTSALNENRRNKYVFNRINVFFLKFCLNQERDVLMLTGQQRAAKSARESFPLRTCGQVEPVWFRNERKDTQFLFCTTQQESILPSRPSHCVLRLKRTIQSVCVFCFTPKLEQVVSSSNQRTINHWRAEKKITLKLNLGSNVLSKL